MKETELEEAAERFLDMCNGIVVSKSSFIAGAKYQADRMYSDMQEYAEFCVECDRSNLKLIVAKDWFEQFKKK
jgi:hypothetical protein